MYLFYKIKVSVLKINSSGFSEKVIVFIKDEAI